LHAAPAWIARPSANTSPADWRHPPDTPRPARPTLLTPFEPYLRERLQAFPDLSARRLLRELKERGYTGGYTILKAVVRAIRPTPSPSFERRFETPRGKQAQVDFAFFKTTFADEPEVERIVWLFSMVLGHSRMMWARFVACQDLQTVLRCHIAAFDSFGGVLEQILYDRMKTAVLSEVEDPDQPVQGIAYNPKLLSPASHYGFLPKACKPYRAKTKGKVKRPFRYVREDFFLARSFRNLEDLNIQPATLDRIRQYLVGLKMPRAEGAGAHPAPARTRRTFRPGGPSTPCWVKN
jgi:transposase